MINNINTYKYFKFGKLNTLQGKLMEVVDKPPKLLLIKIIYIYKDINYQIIEILIILIKLIFYKKIKLTLQKYYYCHYNLYSFLVNYNIDLNC